MAESPSSQINKKFLSILTLFLQSPKLVPLVAQMESPKMGAISLSKKALSLSGPWDSQGTGIPSWNTFQPCLIPKLLLTIQDTLKTSLELK